MEANWIDALRNTPLPPRGSLTDRALEQATPRPQRTRPFVAVGSLVLAATVPLALWCLQAPEKKIARLSPPPASAAPLPTPAPRLAVSVNPTSPAPTLRAPRVTVRELEVLPPRTRLMTPPEPELTQERTRLLSLATASQTRFLTPLSDAPRADAVMVALAKQERGIIELRFAESPSPRVDSAYEATVAIYDNNRQLLTTAKTELSPERRSVALYCGSDLNPVYYQVRLVPVQTFLVVGKLLEPSQERPLTLAGSAQSLPNVQLGEPLFWVTPAREVTARVRAAVATTEDARYTFHMALYDQQQELLGTATGTMANRRLVISKPSLEAHEVNLSFRALSASPTHYQLKVTRGEPLPSAAPQDYLSCLREAQKQGSGYELLIAPEFNQTLLAAAERGDEAVVIELVQRSWFGGPESAAKGGNAITWAAYCPSAEPLKRLLARRVSVGVADANGTTGLHRTYRTEIAQLLLESGAPVEARNREGETPLLVQARQCDPWLERLGVIKALLTHKADPNATDLKGRTPLMYAAQSGVVGAVEALLEAGADPARKDHAGKRARDYARAWAWELAPGYQTTESLKALEQQANADRERIVELLR